MLLRFKAASAAAVREAARGAALTFERVAEAVGDDHCKARARGRRRARCGRAAVGRERRVAPAGRRREPDQPGQQPGRRHPSLAAIGGVPYVAWSEDDGTNFEIRVARLNAAGTAWEQVVGGASPINQANNRGAVDAEPGGDRRRPLRRLERVRRHQLEVRVSRLNAAGTAWEQVVGGAEPDQPRQQPERRRPEPGGDRRRALRRLERVRRHQQRGARQPPERGGDGLGAGRSAAPARSTRPTTGTPSTRAWRRSAACPTSPGASTTARTTRCG